ncbi:MAG: hypothetical protein Q9163_003698 [Psora crenata]
MDYDEAPNTLLLVADTARFVGYGFNKFLTPVSSSAAEIGEVISNCFAISSGLQKLANAIRGLQQISWYHRYQDRISDLAYSLDYTFKDVHGIVGHGLKDYQDEGMPQTASFCRVWADINGHIQTQSGNSLCRRLEHYKLFLESLNNILKEGTPVWTAFITHQIHSPAWITRADAKTIHLADLHKYLFADDYIPQMGPGGQHELSFIKADGGFFALRGPILWACLLANLA